MKRIERTARIGTSPDALFAYLADLGNLPEWQTGIVEARITSSGPLGVGSTALVTRELMGQRIEAPLTVTEHDPPRRLALTGEVSGITAAATLDLAEADGGGGTDLTFAMEIRGSMLTAFMEPMIASAATADVDASLDRLSRRFASA